MFQDDTVKAKKTACGSIAHAGRCRPLSLEPFCAGAVGVFVCAQASALARQTCAASRRAFSRAQHFLYNSCTCVTDACPWPHRVSDALPGRAAAHCQLLVTLTGKMCPPPHKGASQQPCSAAAPSHLPAQAQSRPRAGVLWLQRPCVVRAWAYLKPCCAGAVNVFVCAQASALARQTCAASRRAFSRAQHFLYNSCTCVTDACPWPHRVSDALPGRAAAHCQLLVTLTGKKCPPPHKGASQQPCSAAAPSHLPAQAQSRPRAGVLWLQRPCVVRAWACLRPTQKYVSR